MKSLDVLLTILLVIGGLNWGLVGFFNVDLVASIFGSMSALSRIVYAIVGLSSVYYLLNWRAIQNRWAISKA